MKGLRYKELRSAACALTAIGCIAASGVLRASEQTMPGMPPMQDMHAGHHPMTSEAVAFLMGQSSGTSRQPAAWPMPMSMTPEGSWSLMWMGQAFVVGTAQSGPRGDDGFYSTNWGMLGAARPIGDGALMLRTMASLEPLTISDRRYPLLFQTGETAFGEPIVDGQHPHDLLMEASVQYVRPTGGAGLIDLYYAPVGDVALGPVAFPHRASALEIPQATLSHHWQDSTHIASNVFTAGWSTRVVGIEASGFRGREPDENRWNVDFGKMDSWSTRLRAAPSRNWSLQGSVGRLHEPEVSHPGDVVRATASLHHFVARPNGSAWATSLIWARNYKTIEKKATHAVVAETTVSLGDRDHVSARLEWSQRDELFSDHDPSPAAGDTAYDVTSFTLGYTRDLILVPGLRSGIGANVTGYAFDDALKPSYGNRPFGVSVFIRLRLDGSARP
jgi:hypothetical protein